MLLTEKEAREKECRAGGPHSTLRFNNESYFTWPRCSASICMTGWRWFDYKTSSKSQWDDGLSRGYCGLAGKVEE